MDGGTTFRGLIELLQPTQQAPSLTLMHIEFKGREGLIHLTFSVPLRPSRRSEGLELGKLQRLGKNKSSGHAERYQER